MVLGKLGFPGGASGKAPACQCKRRRRRGFDPWVRKIPWSRKWHPTSVLLPGKSHGQRSLAGYRPWDCREPDAAEQVSTHTCYYKPQINRKINDNVNKYLEGFLIDRKLFNRVLFYDM